MPSDALRTLVSRFDAEVFDPTREVMRIRLETIGDGAADAVIAAGTARLETPEDDEPDALLRADEATWERIATDLRGGMDAFRASKLSVRYNLHAGIGFLAATSDNREPGRLEFKRAAGLSYLRAGVGAPVVMLHGLGATKVSLLPTVAALGPHFHAIAVDLPGHGDSDKPIGAPYDARYFARSVVRFLDALDIDRAHVVGNSLGGRVALEVGLRYPERVRRLGLLAPSMAWRRDRPWAPLLRLVRPELGLLQLAPRPVVEGIVRRIIPGAQDGWTAVGVDEFLRSYMTARGRAAFYAAARQIYLEEPEGDDGFWPRLRTLEPDALFVWGRQDQIVPLAFARHVSDAVPGARHLELDCGHVPQLERPREAHAALLEFFR
ncbi:MAG TPA: alpha/beta fold hydrolase [Solirubrobacteraceae bacterium]|jgi:pimeloyl-ACP methyl ester carboxylesterase|nr:alpha/beta fold hydrolase [Solirubrobacteraceae bacterium]